MPLPAGRAPAWLIAFATPPASLSQAPRYHGDANRARSGQHGTLRDRLASGRLRTDRLLIVVDQAEELFSQPWRLPMSSYLMEYEVAAAQLFREPDNEQAASEGVVP